LVTYTSVSTTDSLRVRYVAQDPGSNGLPATITNYATEGYWVIGMTEPANVSGATYSLELETVDLPGVQDISGLRILKRNAPADPWLLAGTQAAAAGTSIRETAVTGFSEFAIGTTSVNSLPVSFGSFTAQVRNLTQVALEWNTLTERDNQYFEIERSADGRAFTGIGRVTGRGSSLSNSAYNFVDVQPGTGKVFYRIRQVDKTGRYAYSKTLMVQLDAMLGLTLSPNPVRSDVLVNIGMYKAQSGIRLSVMDMNGKTHYAARVQSGAAFRLDMQGYAPGIYTIRLSDEASGMQQAEKKLMKL
jgi:hypothetical protein